MLHTINKVGIIVGCLLLSAHLIAQSDIHISEKTKAMAAQSANIEISSAMTEKMQTIVKTMQSEDWQRQQQYHIQEIKQLLNMPITDKANEVDTATLPAGRVVLFVSESIPLSTLRNYAKSLAKIDGVMVFRGVKGGLKKIQPMVQLIADINRQNAHCHGAHCAMLNTDILIDPVLFRQQNITQVPAIIYQPEFNMVSYCERQSMKGITAARSIVYGDASLLGMLETLYGLEKNTELKRWIKQLEEA